MILAAVFHLKLVSGQARVAIAQPDAAGEEPSLRGSSILGCV